MVSWSRWFAALVLLSGAAAGRAATYYVDSAAGGDANSGTAPADAWRTLDRVNRAPLAPGDRVLFRGSGVWHGQLAPRASGKAGEPIVFDRYGEGALPLIAGDGALPAAVLLRNVQHVEVHRLAVTNHGAEAADRHGVEVLLENYGTARHVVLADLYVHDVNGVDAHKDSGGILFRTTGEAVPSRFDDLEIERNIVWKVDRSGIVGESSNITRSRWFPSRHVIIRDNYVDDIGGDGIVPWATEGALVTGNVARRCNQRSADFNVGIWQWSTRDTLLSWNEAFQTKGTRDGEGFDSDYNSRNTRFVHNYSHDNDGGFMLICTPVKRDPGKNIGNTGTVVRQNISRDDKGLLVNLSGADDVRVAGNRFYVGPNDNDALIVSKWDGWSKNAVFTNNDFFVEGALRFGHGVARLADGSYTIAPGWGGAVGITFSGNRYFGKVTDPPADDAAAKQQAPASRVDWSSEPTFNPAHPETYAAYLRLHRAWMRHLFEHEFAPGALGG